MGKKSRSQLSPTKTQKKPQIHNLIKILRPKVYITDSSNFKNLVQQLTGNGNSPETSPPPSISAGPTMYNQDHGYQENSLDLSFDSSCLDGSPDPFNYAIDEKIDLLSDLESLLMGMDNYDYGSCYEMAHQQEVSLYDYDISSFM